jgi:type I restriction enzyme M protein
MAKIERVTENLVRKALQAAHYEEPSFKIVVEEQKSAIEAVQRSLSKASKTGGGGSGAPEFIISHSDNPDFLIVIECKADTKDHESSIVPELLSGQEPLEDSPTAMKRIARFAVDGVLHYARFLKRDFNVIAVAVSGQTKSGLRVSAFIHAKGASHARPLHAPEGAAIEAIIPWSDYIRAATFDPVVRKLRFDELMGFSRSLHNFMRDHAKLTEEQKPLLVSGTLIALRNEGFAKSFDNYKGKDLQKLWFDTIQAEFAAAAIPQAKVTNMVQPYSSLFVHPELGKQTKAYPKSPLHEIVRMLAEKVWPFFGVYKEFDIVGQFYGEFLKYTGGDGKGLGIVLTPRHVTELFAMLANVTKDSKVLDLCAGTGGFLISAMHQMGRTAVTDADHKSIRERGLVGVEQQPHMFALAASNMILRGDGKANLYQGSCFDEAIAKAIKAHKCDVGLLNPPYSQKATDLHELAFVKQMLDCLAPGGTGVAVVQMSNAIAPNAYRDEILKAHTLEAVMSLPSDLFYPVGVVTCIMVFTAHRAHKLSDRDTWFGYWKDDAHVKVKLLGRTDIRNNWPATRDRWVDAYRNRREQAGQSIKRKVTAADEWCAEAYMETDYTKLTPADFKREVKRHLMFQFMNEAAEGGFELDSDGV